MKYLLLIPLFIIGCGGDLPPNCGDNTLQADELCELGSYTTCASIGYMSGVAYCDDCRGWDVVDCVQRNK